MSDSVTAFCVPGRHPAAAPTGTLLDGAALPPGWQLIPARYRDGRWVHDEASPARVCCCPDHHPDQEAS